VVRRVAAGRGSVGVILAGLPSTVCPRGSRTGVRRRWSGAVDGRGPHRGEFDLPAPAPVPWKRPVVTAVFACPCIRWGWPFVGPVLAVRGFPTATDHPRGPHRQGLPHHLQHRPPQVRAV